MINMYTANGQKLRTKYYTSLNPVIVPVNTIRAGYSTSNATLRLDDYLGNILYENGLSDVPAYHPLTKVLTPEGYIDYAAGRLYCYFRQDHLGSIREVDSYAGNNRTVVQKTQYYPSGTPFAESFKSGEQPYKFTGKELITMHGLNWQDFGARWMDNVRMQFTTVDPHAERYFSISPYAYCKGNPVNAIDPNGMDATDPKPATDQTTAIDNTATKDPQKVEPVKRTTQTNSPAKTAGGNKKETPTVIAKTKITADIIVAKVDVYGTTEKEGTTKEEVTFNSLTKLKETDASRTLGVINTSVNADGSGGSIGIGPKTGTISIGGKVGNLVTFDYSVKIPFTNLGYGITITFNPENLIVIPLKVTVPETNLIPILVP